MAPAVSKVAIAVPLLVVLVMAGAAPAATAQSTAKADKPLLTIAPIPAPGKPAATTPILRWSTGNAAPGLVTVTPRANPKEVTVAAAPTGTAELPWLQGDQEYTFRLYATAPSQKKLVTLVVGKGTQAALQNAAPDDPIDTPAVVDRLLQVMPYLLGLLLLALTGGYFRSLRD